MRSFDSPTRNFINHFRHRLGPRSSVICSCAQKCISELLRLNSIVLYSTSALSVGCDYVTEGFGTFCESRHFTAAITVSSPSPHLCLSFFSFHFSQLCFSPVSGLLLAHHLFPSPPFCVPVSPQVSQGLVIIDHTAQCVAFGCSAFHGVSVHMMLSY